MKPKRKPVFLLLAALSTAPLCAQETKGDKAAAQENRKASEGEASRSTLEVKPGPPTIKTKDIIKESKITPWKRLPRYFLHDQKAIWTSPFHTSKADAKWWAIFGGTGALLLATDTWTSKQLPNTKSQVSVATWSSRVGAAYSLLPISGAFYFVGLGTHNERFRETGILAFETLASSEATVDVIKTLTHRERPLEGTGKGTFWGSKGTFWNSSFPSGHAINSWALASIIAHEYPHPLIIPITAYGLATEICASRLAAQKHFPSDVLVGAAIGWFIGDYVYAKRHNRELDQKPLSAAERVLAHVHLGGPERATMLSDPEAQRAAVLSSRPFPE